MERCLKVLFTILNKNQGLFRKNFPKFFILSFIFFLSTVPLTVFAQPPSVRISPREITAQPFTFSFTISDSNGLQDITVFKFLINREDITENFLKFISATPGLISINPAFTEAIVTIKDITLPQGSFQITINLVDRAGNQGTDTVTLISPGGPPTAPFILSGQVFDGRKLAGPGLSAIISVWQADGVTPISIDGGSNTFNTNADGTYRKQISGVTSPVIILRVLAATPFKTETRAVKVEGGTITQNFFLSSTIITGRVTTPDGQPVEVDIWAMRNDSGDGKTFDNYAIAGGRDFIPPVPPSGVKFGIDTDVHGNYTIPIRVPDRKFRLALTVDRKTDRFDQALVDLDVPANRVIVKNIQLKPLPKAIKFPVSFTLSGQVFDGRKLGSPGLPATISVFETDGVAPIPVEGGKNSFSTNTDGTYQRQMNINSIVESPVIIVEAKAADPFKPVRKAVRIECGKIANADFYISNTVITGKVTGPDGQPVEVDIWAMRNNIGDKKTFDPYDIAGGRDFIEPVPKTNSKFGIDTDLLGNYSIPIRVPDALFLLTLVVDRETDKFESISVDLNIPSGQVIRKDILLIAAGAAMAGTARVSFSQQIQPIFNANCSCHLSSRPPLGLSLREGESWQNLVNVPSSEVAPDVRVLPGNSMPGPGGSYLIEKLTQSPPRVGARMPLGMLPLPQDLIDLIKTWIYDAAPNN